MKVKYSETNIVKNIVKNNELDYIIICEDFNLVLNPDMDCYNYKTTNNQCACAPLIDMISEQNLKDTFRLLHRRNKSKFKQMKNGKVQALMATWQSSSKKNLE